MSIQLILGLFFLLMVFVGFTMATAVWLWYVWKDYKSPEKIVYRDRVVYRENDCNHSQHSIHDDWSEPEPEIVEQKRIERQPRYDVIMPEMKRIEEKSNRVYLPAAKERVALPVERKMIGVK